LSATANFYTKLGFSIDEKDANRLSEYIRDFWMDFHPQDKEDKPEFQEEANLDN
jgi:hypothetical protein